MKNLLVFITPRKKFFGEYEVLHRIWIDNSLDLGWKPEDLLLVTNFKYEYNGVRAKVIGDRHFCACRPRSIKTTVVPRLIAGRAIGKDEICWNHDTDAFQASRFPSDNEIIPPEIDMGLTDYGWKSRWCMGSYFFRPAARDIFDAAREIIIQDVEDEDAMLRLEAENYNNFKDRHRRLNITYNFGMRRTEDNWQRADHPLKVVHFHPTYKRVRTWDIFVLGRNGLGHPLVDDRLIKVFKEHGIT